MNRLIAVFSLINCNRLSLPTNIMAARPQIAPKTPDKVLESLFQSYDSNKDGKLTLRQFDDLLGECGVKDEEEKAAITKLADSDNNHQIDFDEFRTLVKVDGLEQILDNQDDFDFLLTCYKTFKEYDLDGDGTVSWPEFYHALTKQGCTTDQIAQYWHFYDEDKSQSITMTELFRGFLKQRDAYSSPKQQGQQANNINDNNDNNDNKNNDKKDNEDKKDDDDDNNNKNKDDEDGKAPVFKKRGSILDKINIRIKIGKSVDSITEADEKQDEDSVDNNGKDDNDATDKGKK